MPIKRHVRRRPARPIKSSAAGFRGHLQRFALSFTPNNFRAYWLNRRGAVRLAKLTGAGVLFVFLVFLWYAKDLPSPGKINARVSAQTTKFYDRTGNKLLYELYGDKNRSIVTFDQMPKTIKNATVAIEDKSFYKHGAFSAFGIARAIQGVVLRDRSKGGGSTITQQYVKNALLTNEYSYSRKIKELILSIEIEAFYSKDDILKLYLNEIPYGNRAYGIESACKTYFPQRIDPADKDQHCAKNLDTGEGALLAAIPNAPSYYSPYGQHIPELLERQHLILDLEAEQGYISQADATANKWDQTKLLATRNKTQNLYANLDPNVAQFVLYAQETLESRYGTSTVTEGGLRVITTMDYDKQMAAAKAVRDNMRNVRGLGGSNAALVSTDPKTGQMYAMIGSYDFNDPNFGNFNVATAGRQPGSSFKPFVYATLFAKNKDQACAKDRTCPTYGPGTTLYDVPTNFGTDANPYKPQNFGGKINGVVTARQALGGSLNIPAVKALYMAGVSSSINTAKSLGITTLKNAPSSYGLSLVLGTGEVKLVEMANAYESFANGGLHYEQTPILKVYDQKNKILEDNTTPKKPKQAIDEQTAYLMADVLSDNNAKRFTFSNSLDIRNGCGNNQNTGCIHVGVKTGTTEQFNDAWTMGFTPDLVAGVWVGNNNNAPMADAAANIAAPIWKQYMQASIGKTSTTAFAKPTGIKTVTLDKQTGRSVTQATINSTVDQFGTWYVPMVSATGKNADIDKVSGKLATECTPPLARQTAYSSAVVPEIPSTDGAFPNWLAGMRARGLSTGGTVLPTESDDVHSCSDVKPRVTISGLSGGGPTYSFKANVTLGTFGTDKPGTGSARLQVYFDDQVVSTQNVPDSGSYSVGPITATSTGSHTIKTVITDTGLYQGTDEQTVNVTTMSGGGNGGDFAGKSPASGSTVSHITVPFSWTAADGGGPYSLFLDNGLIATSTKNSTNVPLITTGTHSWYVKAADGTRTDPLTFTAS